MTKQGLAKYFNIPKADFYATYDKLFKTLDIEEEGEELVGKKHIDAPRFGD